MAVVMDNPWTVHGQDEGVVIIDGPPIYRREAVASQISNKEGYQGVTLNDNPNFKDHAYSYSAFSFLDCQHEGQSRPISAPRKRARTSR